MAKEEIQIQIQAQQALASLGKLKTAAKGFVAALAIREIIQFGDTIIEATRKFQTYQNQLRLITNDSDDLNRVMGLLQQSAIRTRTSFEGILDLFVKLRVSTDALGISEERVIAVTEKLSQALQVAGADTATANAVIRQFGQAMASGEVRGDEFRSIVEGLGPALAIMARESGLTVGELRKMSRAGELTAEVMFKLFEQSESLTAAFNTQRPTISQLETALSDAFDRALVKLGEVTGATSAYERLIKSLTRSFDDLADTEGALVNQSVADIMAGVRDETITASAALEEFQARLEYLRTGAINPYAMGAFVDRYRQAREELEPLIQELENLISLEKERNDAQAAALKQAQENQKKLNELLAAEVSGLDSALAQADKWSKLKFGTPYEQAKEKLDEAVEVLNNLIAAQEVVNRNQELNNDGLKDFTDEIAIARAAVRDYQRELDAFTQVDFDTFYTNLIMNAQKSVSELDVARRALERLTEEFEAGNIPLEVYKEALDALNNILDNSTEKLDELATSIQDYNDALQQSTEDLQAEFDQLNMSALEKDIDNISRKMRRDLNEQIKRLRELEKEGVDKAEIDRAIEQITKSTEIAIAEQQRLAEQIYEQQRTFAYGWEKAFEEYADNATNAAKQAERIFQTTTRSMEDSIVNFAKTGKFEFRGLVNDILEQLLRSQIQQLIASTFGAFGKSGGGSILGNIFGGFFANGGTLGAGKFGIAGEAGPELITGPATITPLSQLGGTQMVTYNINAVDASSFKSLVARDPGFIHAVAQQGARKVPSRR